MCEMEKYMDQGEVLCMMLDCSIEIAVLFDHNGVVLYANQAAQKHFEYSQLLGRSVVDVFPNDFSYVSGQLTTDVVCDGVMRDMVAYRENQTCFSVQAKFVKPEDETGRFFCLANNVTEQNQVKRRLLANNREVEEADRVKTEFVANVTHELRTPVNGILGNLKELMDIETDERKLRHLRLGERGCADMNSIINNILDFSKLDANKFELEYQCFDFRNMMDYVYSTHINKMTEKGLELNFIISPKIPEKIIGDELRIERILNNLLSNAYKFTSVGRIVAEVVLTERIENRIELFFLVSDTGIGIDEEGQRKLFQSFTQVDASISRKYGGTGLGLTICKQLVELMDGNIRVQSRPNQGSTFSFSIWVEVPENTKLEATISEDKEQLFTEKVTDWTGRERVYRFGTKDNKQELEKRLSKLLLSVDMGNWEKAEEMSETVRELTANAPKEQKTLVLRLKMAVQKENAESAIEAGEALRTYIRAGGAHRR